MYCSHCGAAIAQGAAFCSSCGRSTAPAQDYFAPPAQTPEVLPPQAQPYHAQKSAIRQSETATLNSLLAHFAPKQAQYEAYDAVCEKVNYLARGTRNGLLIWGAIIASLSLLFLLGFSESGMGDDGLTVVFLLFLLPGLLMVAGGILIKVFNRKNLQRSLEDYERLSVELCNHHAAYPNCPVGPEYSNPHVLTAILQRLQSGRADTIKESINQLMSSANQRALNHELAQTQKNTAHINAQTRVPVILLPGKYFL